MSRGSGEPLWSESVGAALADLLDSLESLEDLALPGERTALQASLAVVRQHAKRLEAAHRNHLPGHITPAWAAASVRTGQLDRPDPQVLRAIDDIRKLRAETVQERKARLAVEADLHREVLGTARLLLGLLERRWAERVATQQMAARFARRLADVAGLEPDEARGVQVTALLQDIGLIALPDALLRSSTVGLSPVERSLYQQHPVIAEETLGTSEFADIARWIRCHHERWDGTGYPDGLAGESIPMPARIVALATGYVEAVRREGGTARTWRREQIAGGAFDPHLLRLLERMLRQRNP